MVTSLMFPIFAQCLSLKFHNIMGKLIQKWVGDSKYFLNINLKLETI